MNEELEKRLHELKKTLYIDEKREKIAGLKTRLNDESLWKDWEEGQKVSQDLASLQKDVEDYDMLELIAEEGNESEFENVIKKLEFKTFLSGKHDENNALLSIHAGQGGTEALDWTEMLLRMYMRYAEKNRWETELINSTPGEEAGIKTVTIEIKGKFAYGFLKNESGVHRLVRQSPFNANDLRQTSFALVEVIPVIEDDVEIEIKPEEIEFEAFRSGGHGGQNVNKVSTAVRIKHLPTGITVVCQTQRYQAQNRENAMKLLMAKLFTIQMQEEKQQKDKLKGGHITPGWGNQIRSYVLHPYKMVKDLRTNFESSDAQGVLDGNLDEFVKQELSLSQEIDF